MRLSGQHACIKATVESTLRSSSRVGFRNLKFPPLLESRFEADTRKERCRRMWFEGLAAAGAFNICLLLDFLLVRDVAWNLIVLRTACITPIALVVNEIVRRNPPPWLREGVVAVGMFFICLINILVEGNTTTASTLFGVMCLFITALFAGVVMRLRFPYSLGTLSAMLVAGIWSLTHSPGLQLPEAVTGASMMTVGVAMILVAGFSIEAEERSSFLLGLQHDLQANELAWANQALKQLSSIDKLTRLPNRRALDERAALLWNSCSLAREYFSTIVIDVDHFKAINDNYGHLFGDDTLRQIAAILPQVLRSEDDMAARFGGEEFVLLLPDAERGEAIAVAERIRRLVESAHSQIDPALKITVSCGVSTYRPGGSLKWNDLITTADQALYQAKRNGRNRVEFFACEEPPPLPRRAGDRSSSHAPRLSGLLRARVASTGAVAKSTTPRM